MGSFTLNNDTYACNSETCMLSCASPEFGSNVCYSMQQNFLDGTTCGGGGHCNNVRSYDVFDYSLSNARLGSLRWLLCRKRSRIMDQRQQTARYRSQLFYWRNPPPHVRWLHMAPLSTTPQVTPKAPSKAKTSNASTTWIQRRVEWASASGYERS